MNDDHDPDDAPELTPSAFRKPSAKWSVAGNPAAPDAVKKALKQSLSGKTRVNICLDNYLIEYFKVQAGNRGYQTLINAVLREVVEGRAESGNAFSSTSVNFEVLIRTALQNEFSKLVPVLFGSALHSVPEILGSPFGGLSAATVYTVKPVDTGRSEHRHITATSSSATSGFAEPGHWYPEHNQVLKAAIQ